LASEEMIEFIALRSKMYAYRTKKKEEKKLKGIGKHVVKTNIAFEDYQNSLENNICYEHKM
jgi:hypothetical protein